jgi:hypothetical protein
MILIILAFGANFISCWIRIRIRNADQDPEDKFNADPCGSGNGSGSLLISHWMAAGKLQYRIYI